MYLQSYDNEARPWQWQIRNIVIFCQIHFFRGIQEATGEEDWSQAGLNALLRDVIDAESEEAYDEIIRQICCKSIIT